MDKSDNSKIFGYEASVGEFKTLAGKKKIYIINNSLESP